MTERTVGLGDNKYIIPPEFNEHTIAQAQSMSDWDILLFVYENEFPGIYKLYELHYLRRKSKFKIWRSTSFINDFTSLGRALKWMDYYVSNDIRNRPKEDGDGLV